MPRKTGSRWTPAFLGSVLLLDISGNSQQQGLDWVLAFATRNAAFSWSNHTGWPRISRRTIRIRGTRSTTADTGIAAFGLGPMPTFLIEATPRAVEALVYDMPFGFVAFRKAVLWHNGQQHVFRNLQEANEDAKQLPGVFAVRTKTA